MNKLKSDIYAGIGLEWDDIRFEQAAVREAFYGLCSAFGIAVNDGFIITGCVITGTPPTQVYSDGFISLGGEIYRVSAAALPVIVNPGDVLYFDVDVTFDPAGFESFENSTSGDTYEVRTASIKVGPPPVNYMPYNAKTLAQRIAEVSDPFHPAINWSTRAFIPIQPSAILPNEPWIDNSGYAPVAGDEPRWKIDTAGNIHLQGSVTCIAVISTVLQLPSILSPTKPVDGMATITDVSLSTNRPEPIRIKFIAGGWRLGWLHAGSVLPAIGDIVSFNFIYQKV